MEKCSNFTERVYALMVAPILRTEKVSKWYNAGRNDEVRAIQEVSLEIMENDSVVLYGPSGSGKTSLLGLMATIDRPTEGRILLMGRDVSLFSDAELSRMRREAIGFVFQSFNLFSGMPAWENVAYPMIPLGYSTKYRFERAGILLERLGLGDRLYHKPEELSGGEQQRVAIARALINNPKILFADEPTSNIDAEAVGRLLDIFAELTKEGRTIVFATHDPALQEHGNVVVSLNRGRVTGVRHLDTAVNGLS
jgi:putative ABC transport system ATP-binding protein